MNFRWTTLNFRWTALNDGRVGVQVALVEGEGIELMVIMLQARKFAARCALKVLLLLYYSQA